MISYLRKGAGKCLVCVHNFTPETRSNYFIRLGSLKAVREVLNTDDVKYGGSNQVNPQIPLESSMFGSGFRITLAPLATMIFEVDFEKNS